jgi:DNA-directed RNA polymerase specialized sigma24 family protein
VSLGATTLLHEAYLDMAARGGPSFPDRARFMGYAARVMRGLIIDHARERTLRSAVVFSRLLRSTPTQWRTP